MEEGGSGIISKNKFKSKKITNFIRHPERLQQIKFLTASANLRRHMRFKGSIYELIELIVFIVNHLRVEVTCDLT